MSEMTPEQRDIAGQLRQRLLAAAGARRRLEGSIEPRLRGSLGDQFPGGGLEIPPEFERRSRNRFDPRVHELEAEVDEFIGYDDPLAGIPQLLPFDPRVVDTIPPLRNPSPYDNETDLQRRQVFDEFNEEAGANTFEEAERLRKFREHKAFWDESDRLLAEAEAPALRSRAYSGLVSEAMDAAGDTRGPGLLTNAEQRDLARRGYPLSEGGILGTGRTPGNITIGGKDVPLGRDRTGDEIVDLGGRNNPKALAMLIRDPDPAVRRAAQQALNAWRRNYEAELGGGGVAPDGGLVTSFVPNRGADNPVALKRAKKTLDALLAGEKPELSTGRRGGRPPTWTPPEREPSLLGWLGRLISNPDVVFESAEPGDGLFSVADEPGDGLFSVPGVKLASARVNAQKQKDARDARAAVEAERMQKRRDWKEAKARGRSDVNKWNAQADAIRRMGPEGAQHFLGNLNKQRTRDATIRAAQIAADAKRDVAKREFPGKTPAEIAGLNQATADAVAAAELASKIQARDDHPIMQRIQLLRSFLAREGISTEQALKYEADILSLHAEYDELMNPPPDATEGIAPGAGAGYVPPDTQEYIIDPLTGMPTQWKVPEPHWRHDHPATQTPPAREWNWWQAAPPGSVLSDDDLYDYLGPGGAQ